MAEGLTPRHHARELRETPRWRAFCRIAPSVLLNLRAIFGAGVFFLASCLNSRTSAADHARRLIFFFGMSSPIRDSARIVAQRGESAYMPDPEVMRPGRPAPHVALAWRNSSVMKMLLRSGR